VRATHANSRADGSRMSRWISGENGNKEDIQTGMRMGMVFRE